jgi:hypothetical protein
MSDPIGMSNYYLDSEQRLTGMYCGVVKPSLYWGNNGDVLDESRLINFKMRLWLSNFGVEFAPKK